MNDITLHNELTQAEVSALFGYGTTTTNNGDMLSYRLYVPRSYDAGRKYPLLVILHGAGERGNDNEMHLKYMLKTMFNTEGSPVTEAIILCPQCPENKQWVNTPWAKGNYSSHEIDESAELKAVVAVMQEIITNYRVDPARVYVIGLSMGGFGTWDLITRHADIFAAGVPICGGGDPSKAKELAKMPIYTFHGEVDPDVPVSGTREMAEAIRASNPIDFTYEELVGAGHNIWETVAARSNVIDWLFSHRK